MNKETFIKLRAVDRRPHGKKRGATQLTMSRVSSVPYSRSRPTRDASDTVVANDLVEAKKLGDQVGGIEKLNRSWEH